MLSYIVRVVTVFKDCSEMVKYYEFRELEKAKDFINDAYDKTNFKGYSYEITILKCEEIKLSQ